jgi:uroporphyrinogen decarboxylase
MWRRVGTDGLAYDVFGRCFREEKTQTGSYEVNVNVLDSARSVEDLRSHPWPDPSWWDFSPLQAAAAELNRREEHHIRFRSGSVFEVAWQLRGMDKFMMDLALDPSIPEYIMDRITEVLAENIDAALTEEPDALDMVYFYDDVASKDSLLISRDMWSRFIKPRHQRIIEVIKKHGKRVMYHTDGAVFDLLPELIDMGIDVLNPIQPDARDMEPKKLKEAYGDELSFHGGIDIIETLPRGTVEDVKNEVAEKAGVLGRDGGYILASSHHIQSDTPLENVLAMYGMV